jgi:hypothetical protein
MQAGGRGAVGVIREAQCAFELGGRLTVRAQRRGAASGGGRVPQCRGAIVGRLRMERQAGVVVTPEGLQRRKNPRMNGGGRTAAGRAGGSG